MSSCICALSKDICKISRGKLKQTEDVKGNYQHKYEFRKDRNYRSWNNLQMMAPLDNPFVRLSLLPSPPIAFTKSDRICLMILIGKYLLVFLKFHQKLRIKSRHHSLIHHYSHGHGIVWMHIIKFFEFIFKRHHPFAQFILQTWQFIANMFS